MEQQPESRDGAYVAETLDWQARRLRRRAAWRRLVLAVAPYLLVPLLAVIADHRVQGGLPRPLIAGMGLAWSLAIMVGLGMWLARWLKDRPSQRYVAHHIEQAYRIPHNLVLNAVDVHHDPAFPYAVDKAEQHTADVLRHPPANPPERLGLGRRWLVPGAAAAAWVLYAAVAPKPIWPSLARFFGMRLAPPTETRIEWLRPGPGAVCYLDRPLAIEVGLRGRLVDEVVFEILSDDSDAAGAGVVRLPMTHVDDPGQARFRLTLAPNELSDELRYRVRAGDATLSGVVELSQPTSLVDWAVTLERPAYTGLPTVTVSDAEIRVPAGTRATFVAHASGPMRDPVFVYRADGGEVRTRMIPLPGEPTAARVTMRLTESGVYKALFTDAAGRVADRPTVRRVVVRADAAPRVEIVYPTEAQVSDGRVDVTYVASLRAKITDDYGLAGVELVLADGQGQPLRRPVVRDASGLPKTLDVEIATADLGLDYGQELRCWFEAWDDRHDLEGQVAPQIGRSRVLRLMRSAEPEPPPALAAGESETGRSGQASDEQSEQVSRVTRSGSGGGDGQDQADGQSQIDGQGPGDGGGAARAPGGRTSGADGETDGPDAPTGDGGTSAGHTSSSGRSQGEGQPADTADASPAGDGGGLDEAIEAFAREFGREAARLVKNRRDAAAERPGAESQAQRPGEAGEDGDGGGQNDVPEAAQPSGREQQASHGEQQTDNQQAQGGQQAEDAGSSDDAAKEAQNSVGQQPSKQSGAAANPGELAGSPRGESRSTADGQGGAQVGPPAGAGEQPGDHAGRRDTPSAEPDAAEALDEVLELLKDDEPLDEEALEALGVSAERARAFVKAFERLQSLGHKAGLVADPRRVALDARPGSGELLASTPASAGVERITGETYADRLTRIVAPRDQLVPPTLETLLAAYYRAIAEQATHEAAASQPSAASGRK